RSQYTRMCFDELLPRTREPFPIAKMLWLSPTPSRSTQCGTDALQIISSLRTSKAQACCGVAEVCRKKSGYLGFQLAQNSQISPQIGHCLPAIRVGGFCI